MGYIYNNKRIEYYSDDILCWYKIPVSCKIYKTLYCKHRVNDNSSDEIIKKCGCNIDIIDINYGKKIYINGDCSRYITDMNGYERIMLGMRVDVNSANIYDLMSIDGIGESLAERIIDYRIENGNYRRIEELINIRGIGESKLKIISKYLCIDCR